MRNVLRAVTAGSLLLWSIAAMPQENGGWLAYSSNAKSITGDVDISADRITIDLISFPVARIRALDRSEMNAAFDSENAVGNGSLYRLNIPFSRKFLKKNSLCGSEDTTWMATYVHANTLQIEFFSGQKPPVLTLDALANSSDTCGVFTYAR